MIIYRCPVCKKPLNKQEYEKALGILGERERHLKHEKAALQEKLRQEQTKAKRAKEEGIKVERARTKRLLQGKEVEIQRLKERIIQLRRGSTPQTEGLEFEDKLAAKLKQAFSDDDVQHKGKSGDILHTVRSNGKTAGIIVYECKREPTIKTKHVQQAYRAKQSREADFAVLVTTGQKKGFSGLMNLSGVLIVAPLGVIHLASLLRLHLIEMFKANITREERAVIAERLLKYIASPQFKNTIEEIVETAGELEKELRDEMKDHRRFWEKRWNHYQAIQWDSKNVQHNLQLVLHGKEPKPITPPKFEPLRLPAPAQ